MGRALSTVAPRTTKTALLRTVAVSSGILLAGSSCWIDFPPSVAAGGDAAAPADVASLPTDSGAAPEAEAGLPVATLVGASQAPFQGADTLTLARPASTLPGDLMLVAFFTQKNAANGAVVWRAPSDWVQRHGLVAQNSVALYHHVAIASEPDAYVFGLEGGTQFSSTAVLLVYRGPWGDQTQVVDNTKLQSDLVAPFETPVFSTSSGRSLVVATFCSLDGNGWAWRIDEPFRLERDVGAIAVASAIQGAPGAVGTVARVIRPDAGSVGGFVEMASFRIP